MLSKIRIFILIIYVFITVSLTVILMFLFRKKHLKIRKIWATSTLKLFGIKIDEIGKLNNDANLIIINHQSMLDIIVLEAISSQNLCWIAKQEIENLPFFGNLMKIPNMISVEREDKKSLLKLIVDVKDRVSKNRMIAIFPEGTRTDGKKLIKFKGGAKILAQKLNLKVQPIILTNTIIGLNSKKLTQNSTTCKIIYMDIIKPSEFENKKWFDDTKNKMQEVLDKNI